MTVEFLTPDGKPPARVQAARGQSLLQVAKAHGVAIEHVCGGVGACSTCHVHVKHGMEHLSEATDSELDRVEEAPDARPDSRLACQARIIHEDGAIACQIPSWNRNIVKET